MKYARCAMLFGADYPKLQKAKILLLGVGGVGSFALDCLYRTGITDITIVDFDRYDESNQNRQMWSEAHVDEIKVHALKVHYPLITTIETKVDKVWIDSFDFEPYDLILDAIDDIHAKLALAQKCYKKLICATGSAKKIDATQVRAASIWKTQGDPFASKIRRELKRRKFDRNYRCIFSAETALTKEKGSFMGVTAAFGLAMCSESVKKLLKES
ncbi:MAG: ThiF family adenylyltransferase [Campylobacterota bacterium]|nr:ThiF family adenylyltransferase [Campylobacterota bacterium]